MTPVNHSTLDDAALIRLIAQKQPDALSELYDRYYGLVFSLALHIVREQATAEEITLDVFTKVWEKAVTYQAEQAKVSTWLTSIARYQSIDVLRRQRVRPEGNSISWAEVLPQAIPHVDNPEEATELTIRRERVRAAVAQLPAEQKEVLALAYFKGYTHRQVSEALGQPLGTVKTRIQLAMKKLRYLLTDE